jgi:hypothetical protein
MQPYEKPGQLDPLPVGQASLYRTPWRSNPRTVSGYTALQGIGAYYKRIPGDWSQDVHNHVMKQMAAAGVRRMRLAPHHTIYLTKDWTAPKRSETKELRKELRACRAAAIRPCVVFVHILPMGKAGTRELQDWWKQGELMPAGDVGSPEFRAYQAKTYEGLLVILKEAKDAGFSEDNSYDLEMGQNLWWGGPGAPRPLPSTDLSALKPGGRIYEFDRGLIQRLRAEGYKEPAVWWGQSHHHFEQMTDEEVPPEAIGRTESFYSAWSGRTTEWADTDMYGNFQKDRHGVNDIWPIRERLNPAEGQPPEMVLARPEGWAADRSRRDNLIELITTSKIPLAITSLGTVPGEIPDVSVGGLDGWTIKARALTRSLAFWLNQGARFVLLHSVYEPGSPEGGAMAHSLIPFIAEPASFRYSQSIPLLALKSFTDGLAGSTPIEEIAELKFEYALAEDPELIPGPGELKALRASDMVAILPFQLTDKRYAVAVYVVTPNIAKPMEPVQMTLRIGAKLTGAGAIALHASGRTARQTQLVECTDVRTVLTFDARDDVTWLVFDVQ